MKWIKAGKRKPENTGFVFWKARDSNISGTSYLKSKGFIDGFGMTYDDYKNIEWLDESESASLPVNPGTPGNGYTKEDMEALVEFTREEYEPEFIDGKYWVEISDEKEKPVTDKEVVEQFISSLPVPVDIGVRDAIKVYRKNIDITELCIIEGSKVTIPTKVEISL